MCNCRTTLESDEQGSIKEFLAKHHKATIKRSSFKETAFPIVKSKDGSTKMLCVTYSTLNVETNKKKKPIDVTIMHSFCPFCGVKYGQEAAV
ncbi:hypothetical protein KI809_10575 [Geobacter pelophilus]|uniref:Uncharacterized protein n=1 Tax=Geoanaerobacter pelophilus TaxID=60036 RepID=A0AAW4L100_9BACT|nr:hypothetical protein [Geoanaerobacter pelophilus]MBT0664744.1 hypothetical protein [Geoanaerobacter pelophilus]